MYALTLPQLLEQVKRPGAAVAFNFISLDDMLGIVKAAELENVPVIIQVTQAALAHVGIDYMAAIGTAAARTARVPVCVHLDHATDFALIMQGIRLGFSSVMIDASALPYEENIKATRRVVDVAHSVGVSVEAELGRIGGREDNAMGDGPDWLTDPDQAERFMAATGVDALAPSVGTAHGLYIGTLDVRFDLIRAIAGRVDKPLVLHGGSDLPDEVVQEAIRSGIRKFNVGTDLRIAHARSLKKLFDSVGDVRASHALAARQAGIEAVCEEARKKIRMCRV